jgi:hypothetical protein
MIAERGVSRGRLAAHMGYRNTSKALRRLDAFLEAGEAGPEFRARLIAALDIDPVQFETAMEATRELQRDEARRRDEAELAAARAAFRPHLRVIPERRIPQPIFVAAFTGVGFWLVQPLPEHVLSMPPILRLGVVGQIARDHYAQEEGHAGPFGAICGYLFRTEFEHALQLDIDGIVRGEQHGPISEVSATLWLARRQIPSGLLRSKDDVQQG